MFHVKRLEKKRERSSVFMKHLERKEGEVFHVKHLEKKKK